VERARVWSSFLLVLLGTGVAAAAEVDKSGAAKPRAELPANGIEDGEWCTPPNAGPTQPSECLLQLGRFPIDGAFVDVERPLRSVSEASLEARHGKPSSRRVWTAPDPREPLAAEHFVELVHPGFTVVLASSDQEAYRIQALRLSDAKLELACGLRVGFPATRFREVLGAPGEGDQYRFDDFFCMEEGPTFRFHPTIRVEPGADGAVKSLSWEYAAD